MSAYKSFAVIGGGMLGLPIVSNLVAQKVSVILLARPDSASKTVPPEVQVIKVDFTDASALAAAFKEHKVEVVISTITTSASAAQTPFVEAAKLAAVRLFVPSEFGMPTEGHTEGMLGAKNSISESVKAAGIPTVRIYNGVFAEYVPFATGFNEHGKIRIVGKGDAQVSFTAVSDIAGFVAHVLTTLPPSELENRIFRIQGDRANFKQVAAQFNTTLEIVDRIPGEMGELRTHLMSVMDTGAGSTGWDPVNKVEGTGDNAAGSANKLWPGHEWKTLKVLHNLQ
ncbi:hypothetical protein B0H11DRAFT_1182859 [Mycena galericulata]|nr:hypothetical protein B0H11DRAFT_1182859 [Mycena galericulata]